MTSLHAFTQDAEFRATLTDVLLPGYLPTQRWFTSKGKQVSKVALDDYYEVTRQSGIAILAVDFTDGSRERYQLPLLLTQDPEVRSTYRERHPNLVLGEITDTGMLADAVGDHDFRAALYEMVHKDEGRGSLTAEAGRAVLDHGRMRESRLPSIDTSNTAITYDDRLFLKLFRKLDTGLNPDLELVRYLSERAGFDHCPRYGGSLGVGSIEDREGYLNLGMMTGKIDNRGDAWDFFQKTTERYLTSDRDGPTEDTLHWVRLLGRRTAEMHLALAAAGEDRPDLVGEPMDADYRNEITTAARKLLDRQLRQLDDKSAALEGEQAELARRVLDSRRELDDRLSALSEREMDGRLTRIHGDYHLGQVLVTLDDYVIIDFEGEPLLTIPERRRKRPPLKDVAGMLRSFHYAAQGQLLLNQERYADHPNPKSLLDRAQSWYKVASRAFLSEYFAVCGDAPFLPSDEADRRALLDLFVLEKAVYEVAYELNSRPAWLGIPLRGVLQTLNARQ